MVVIPGKQYHQVALLIFNFSSVCRIAKLSVLGVAKYHEKCSRQNRRPKLTAHHTVDCAIDGFKSFDPDVISTLLAERKSQSVIKKIDSKEISPDKRI